MKFSLIPKALGHGLLGSLGFGVLLGGMVSSAHAGSGFVHSGTDYVGTPIGGAKYLPPGSPAGTDPIDFTGFAIKSPTSNPLPNPPSFQAADPTTGIGIGPQGPDGGSTPIPNSGSPAILGVADTVINRTKPSIDLSLTTLNPITSMMEMGGVTPIEIVGLSLKSDNPIDLGSTYGSRTLFAGLEKYYGTKSVPPITGQRPSTGEMFIRGDGGVGGTWDSIFTIHAFAFGLPTGSLLDTTVNDFVRTTLEGMITPLDISGNPYACQSNVGGMTFDLVCLPFTKPNFIVKNKGWTATVPPGADILTGPNLVPVDDPASADPNQFSPQDFFLTDRSIPHDAGDGSVHDVSIDRRDLRQYDQVPAPLPVLGLSAAFASLGRMKKLSAVLKKEQG
jgi:hypothetical protein